MNKPAKELRLFEGRLTVSSTQVHEEPSLQECVPGFRDFSRSGPNNKVARLRSLGVIKDS